MASKEALQAAKAAYDIEAACITEMKDYFDDEQFSKAVDLLSKAPRIGAAGSGHSGIICQHFAHLMCCIERPARFISPAEAVHGATGFIQEGDVMVFASRGGKTKELLPIVDICKAKGVKIITVTKNLINILKCLFQLMGSLIKNSCASVAFNLLKPCISFSLVGA